MPRSVSYRITDKPNGRFDVIVVLHPRKAFRHSGLLTLAKAEEWLDSLRLLMAACGVPIIGDMGGIASQARDGVDHLS